MRPWESKRRRVWSVSQVLVRPTPFMAKGSRMILLKSWGRNPAVWTLPKSSKGGHFRGIAHEKRFLVQSFPKQYSETGRIRFRRARFQTPSSVSFLGLPEFRGSELSEFLSAYALCAKANSPSFFFVELTVFAPRNSVRLSKFFSPKQYSRNSIPPVS